MTDGTQIKQKNDASSEYGAEQNASGDGEFYDGADLAGSVVEFSDEGFSDIQNINKINRLWSEQTKIPALEPVTGDDQTEPLFTLHLQNRVDKDSPFEEKIYRLVEGDFPTDRNEIVINQMLADENPGGYAKVICYAAEPERLDELAKALEERCSEKAYVRTNDTTFQKMKISIEQTGRITMFVLGITLITGSLVTGLLLSMWMRGRKTEIAVYVSLGIEKSNLLWQAAVEGLILYVVSFVVSEVLTDHLLPLVSSSLELLEGAGGSRKAGSAGSLFVLGCGMCMVVLLLLIIVTTSVFLFAGWACKSASIQTQNESKQAIGASFRLEENEANRHERADELSKQIGAGISGSAEGYHQEQLASGEWMTWTDNSFETPSMEDILKIAEVDGIAAYNVTTANTVVNPVNFRRIEDKDADQSMDERGVSLRGNLCMELDFDVQKEREASTVYPAKIVGIYDSISGITPIMYGDSYRSENIKKFRSISKGISFHFTEEIKGSADKINDRW